MTQERRNPFPKKKLCHCRRDLEAPEDFMGKKEGGRLEGGEYGRVREVVISSTFAMQHRLSNDFFRGNGGRIREGNIEKGTTADIVAGRK